MIYIKNNKIETTEIINEGRLCILETCIKLENSNKLVISTLYRAHDLPKTEFVYELKKYLKSKRNIKTAANYFSRMLSQREEHYTEFFFIIKNFLIKKLIILYS